MLNWTRRGGLMRLLMLRLHQQSRTTRLPRRIRTARKLRKSTRNGIYLGSGPGQTLSTGIFPIGSIMSRLGHMLVKTLSTPVGCTTTLVILLQVMMILYWLVWWVLFDGKVT